MMSLGKINLILLYYNFYLYNINFLPTFYERINRKINKCPIKEFILKEKSKRKSLIISFLTSPNLIKFIINILY